MRVSTGVRMAAPRLLDDDGVHAQKGGVVVGAGDEIVHLHLLVIARDLS